MQATLRMLAERLGIGGNPIDRGDEVGRDRLLLGDGGSQSGFIGSKVGLFANKLKLLEDLWHGHPEGAARHLGPDEFTGRGHFAWRPLRGLEQIVMPGQARHVFWVSSDDVAKN